MEDKSCKLVCADPKINNGVNKINGDVKNENDRYEFPLGYGKHGIKNAKPIPKWAPLLRKIECSVTINKTSTVNNAGVTEAGVFIDP